jgi:hypothetical protein
MHLLPCLISDKNVYVREPSREMSWQIVYRRSSKARKIGPTPAWATMRHAAPHAAINKKVAHPVG